ncbi:unnamed protein product [Nezara viridula]|uniref:Uncharacterized protein n=1 Tax=Nezara viridula TaxID=85310 RepID=A0A9P0EED0_NEZVI|nr:unnamed protein product [Nezara viridula]
MEKPPSISSVNETLLRSEASEVVGSRVPLCKSEAGVMLMVMMRLLRMIRQFWGLEKGLNSEQFGEARATILWSCHSFRIVVLYMEEESPRNVTASILEYLPKAFSRADKAWSVHRRAVRVDHAYYTEVVVLESI